MADRTRVIVAALWSLIWLCGVIAAIVFVFASVVYKYALEHSVGPSAVAAGWLIALGVMIWLTHRRSGSAGPLSRRASWVLLSLTVCVAALGLSLVSAGLAVRYAMKPESWRALSARARSGVMQIDGREVRYFASGPQDAPRLLFVHGTPGHAGSFLDFVLDPVPGFECVAVDRPGFGGSALGGPLPSFEEQARCLLPLLVERQGKWTILIGHSLGGPIVARMAADAPERVRGLVILAGSLDPETEAPSWYNLLTDAPGIEVKMPELYRVANAEIAAAPENTRALSRVLRKITCAVHVVHGDADALVPVSNVEYIRGAMSAASVKTTVVPGEGHGVHRLRSVVLRAIEDVATRSSEPP